MQGDDLGIFGILWGTAIAFALAAVTMVDSGRKKLLSVLWVAAAIFLAAAIAWPWLAEQSPALKAAAEHLAANKLAINLVGIAIFGLLGFDFWLRSKRFKTLALGANGQPSTEALNNSLQGLFERVGRIEGLPPAATAEDHDKLSTTVRNIDKDTNSKIELLTQNPQTDRDVLGLLNYALYQSAVLMLDALLQVAPTDGTDSPLELGGSFQSDNEAETKFVELARRKLDAGADRRRRFESVLKTAEFAAEHEVEQTPMDQRPTGIDPLVLRKWAITHRQCTRAVAFLQYEKRELEENLLSQRHGLLERYSEIENRISRR